MEEIKTTHGITHYEVTLLDHDNKVIGFGTDPRKHSQDELIHCDPPSLSYGVLTDEQIIIVIKVLKKELNERRKYYGKENTK